jgi:predicted RNase H-like HicB family nuclease
MGAHGKVHVATYSYDGTYWVVQFDDPDVSTFAVSLSKAMANAREALAVTLDFDSVEVLEATLTIADVIGTAHVPAEKITALRANRYQAEQLSRQVQEHTEELARSLVEDDGLSLRDAATAVGVSHQRVAQLVGQRA